MDFCCIFYSKPSQFHFRLKLLRTAANRFSHGLKVHLTPAAADLSLFQKWFLSSYFAFDTFKLIKLTNEELPISLLNFWTRKDRFLPAILIYDDLFWNDESLIIFMFRWSKAECSVGISGLYFQLKFWTELVILNLFFLVVDLNECVWILKQMFSGFFFVTNPRLNCCIEVAVALADH